MTITVRQNGALHFFFQSVEWFFGNLKKYIITISIKQYQYDHTIEKIIKSCNVKAAHF